MNLADFKKQLKQAVKNTEKKLKEVATESVLELQRGVIDLAPIGPDEWNDQPRQPGTLKNSIQVGVNAPSTGSLSADITGSGAVAQGRAATSTYKLGDTLFVTTDVGYARFIEYGLYKDIRNRVRTNDQGFSTQAPAGMFAVPRFEFSYIVNTNLMKVQDR